MVFLKPRIVRSADDLAKYSKVKYEEVRRDSQISRLESSEYLIKDAEPPVLDKYENVLDDGILGSERRKRLAQKERDGELFGQKSSNRRSGRTVIDLYNKIKKPAPSEVETQRPIDDNAIEWDQVPSNTEN